ncbi:hypothetical protein [Yoonia sp. 2307UL14-13]|uniref:hypothetical protein n=1 Tax=Yoonia sp. 2307UL14-13 TaxID=3126506 RepID=UPI003099E87C
MDTQIAPTNIFPTPTTLSAVRQPPSDTKVPRVQKLGESATLPSEGPFIAQVVNARLSGDDFPESPGEIAPSERTLRPYDVPMLPAEKSKEPLVATATQGVSVKVDPDPFSKTD